MSATKEEIWANAQPLEDAFERLLKLLEAEPSTQERLRARRRTITSEQSSFLIIDYSAADKKNLHKLAVDEIKRIIISNIHEAFGFKFSDDKCGQLSKMDSEFVAAAEFDVFTGVAKIDAIRFEQVRIFPDIQEASVHKTNSPAAQTRHAFASPSRRAGRPTHRDRIISAIKARVSEHGTKWWSFAPKERFSAYRSELGIPEKGKAPSGFSEKTLQKYESEYKRLNH